ncbi:DUF1559 family PulG-like putative transporter [Stratiformator vulcanicus]|uniref:DUF1559 domain-containing protein n=1 Tax=Stratiformator vulcanicus TaxID=2527980 RepID=A0A517R1R0_9PLAN|nr:DUF1559 domain-containing protein [Stratiformator vulcanicus]QDT37800.1 hypothetical protein Pan189_21820 [Stratiformator vulcanicus]
MRARSRLNPSRRRGFTWVELLITLIAVAVMIAVLCPALLDGRRRGRPRMVSLNNIKNISLATANYASVWDGMFPPLVDGTYGAPRNLLTTLDQPGLDRAISAALSKEDKNIAVFVKVFASPHDDFNFNQDRGFSYRFNAGWGDFRASRTDGKTIEIGTHDLDLDWDGDGEVTDEDRSAMQATGVFWRHSDHIDSLTIDAVGLGDGISQTLLLVENYHRSDWLSNQTLDLGFVVGREDLTIDFDRGMLAVNEFKDGPYRPNGIRPSSATHTPGPSSSHSGTVNVAFVDGRASNVSEDIDPLVYLKLMTSRGSLFGQTPLDANQF